MSSSWRPPLLLTQVPELVEQLYGFKVQVVQELDSYDDRNILVEWIKGDGGLGLPSHVKTHLTQPSRFLVKVINKQYSLHPDVLAMKNDLSNHLTSQGFKTPCVIENNAGTFQSVIKLTDPNTKEEDSYVFKLLEFVEGTRMDKICLTNQLCYEQGEMTGLMNKLWLSFPSDKYPGKEKLKIFWNMSEMSEVRKSLHQVKDQSRVPLLEEIVTQFESKILKNCHTFSKGFINSDVNDGNTLVTKTADNINSPNCSKAAKSRENPSCTTCKEGTYSVSAIIDFGDLTYSCFLFELAIAVAYSTLNIDGIEPMVAASTVIEGYLKHVKLTSDELKHLQLAVCARLVQSFVYGQVALAEDETNDYTQNHSAHCWPMVQILWKMSEEEFNKQAGLEQCL